MNCMDAIAIARPDSSRMLCKSVKIAAIVLMGDKATNTDPGTPLPDHTYCTGTKQISQTCRHSSSGACSALLSRGKSCVQLHEEGSSCLMLWMPIWRVQTHHSWANI